MGKRAVREPRPGQPVPELQPPKPSLPTVRQVAQGCRACNLYKRGTQTVFGEGPPRADIMMVGEQRGDAEDLAGHPFVGPAGKLLDRAPEQAGIDRTRVYLTPVAGRRNRARHAARARLPPAAQALLADVQGDAAAGDVRPFDPGAARHRHGAPVFHSACAYDESRREELREFVADLKKVMRAVAQQDARRP